MTGYRRIMNAVKNQSEIFRERDCSRFGRQILYPTSESFFSDFLKARGLHTVKSHGNRPLDFYVDFRQSNKTLISLHGSIPPRCKTLPYFSGRRLARLLGVNLIAVVDPTTSIGTIPCSWYLGDQTLGHTIDLLSPYISRILKSFNSEHLVFFGGSGGAFGAVNFLKVFRDSSALVMNPRLDLTLRPHPDLSPYYRNAHGVKNRTARHRVYTKFIQGRQPVDVKLGDKQRIYIFQNENDSRYKNGQVIPFLEKKIESNNIFVRTFEGETGHAPAKVEDLQVILNAIFSAMERGGGEDIVKGLGFQNPAQFLSALKDGSVASSLQ